MGRIRVGPARIPSRESPEAGDRDRCSSAATTPARSTSRAGFWMDYPWAERLGELAREADVALSVHAPLFGWIGHLEASGRKWSSAVGALDRSAGIAAACGAEVVVFHPGFLLGRTTRGRDRRGRRAARARARAARGQGPGGAVRGRGDGSRARPRLARRRASRSPPRRLGAARARLRAHARDERRRVPRGRACSPRRSSSSDERPRRGAPFHIHFSDIAYANRNETHHLPYGEGTLRADPLREALDRFERPATVISESPDEASSQMIRTALTG